MSDELDAAFAGFAEASRRMAQGWVDIAAAVARMCDGLQAMQVAQASQGCGGGESDVPFSPVHEGNPADLGHEGANPDPAGQSLHQP